MWVNKFLSITLMLFSFLGLNAQHHKANSKNDNEIVKNDSSLIFIIVDEMPVFKYKNCSTSDESFLTYVNDSIKLQSEECSGKVYIQFVIEPDSTLTNFKQTSRFGYCDDYEEKLVRIEKVIKSMPKWIPGKQNGKSVRVLLNLPIYFRP